MKKEAAKIDKCSYIERKTPQWQNQRLLSIGFGLVEDVIIIDEISEVTREYSKAFQQRSFFLQ